MKKKRPLSVFVIGVLIALFVTNMIIFFVAGQYGVTFMEVYSVGYLVGMFAMYIAVHHYRWK
jgi:hypothetical protein